MLDAITLYLEYQNNHVVLLRIIMTGLDLLSCTSRKNKADKDLTRNAVLFWNNFVSWAKVEWLNAKDFNQSIVKRFKQVNARNFKWLSAKRFNFDLLSYHAVFHAILELIDDLFSSYEFIL